MHRAHQPAVRGATILEAVLAGALIALFMAGLFEMNARNIQLLKTGKESFAATIVLEERLEQLRCGKWTEITSAAFVQTILAAPPSSGGQLPALSEQITITAYPPAAPPAAAITVTRSAAGAVAVASDNALMPKEDLVRVDLRVTWTGTPGQRTRTRELSTMIADRGLITR
jgi:hypothetical protein